MQLNLEPQTRLKNRAANARARLPCRIAWLVCGLAMMFLRPGLQAQPVTPTNTMLVSSNRFLFIVNTSSSMKKHVAETAGIIGKIVGSAADGQMYRGDTLGIWTFNREVYADFPLQEWEPRNAGEIAGRMTKFIQDQHYTDGSHFEKVMRDLFDVMRVSDFLTVIIISNGEDRLKGTEFDQEINKLIQQNYRDAKLHGVPMVIVLQGRHGKIIRHSVTPFPWPVVVPRTPMPKLMPIARATPPPAPKAVVAAPPVVPNLIIIGKPQPPPIVIAPKPVIAPPPETNLPPVAEVTPPAPQVLREAPPGHLPEIVAQSSPPAISVTNAPAIEPALTNEPAPANVATVEPSTNEAMTNGILAATEPPANRSRALLYGGILLVMIALGLIALMLRRARTAGGTSFITRSMTNKKR